MRLFDVTTLSRAEYRKAAQRHGLGLIVTYRGGTPEAKSELHAAEGAKVTHTFSRLNGESVTAPEKDAADVWSALTNDRNDSPYASAESGLGTVWLNAIQKAALDKSVPQIGAPTAWKAGYDGTGIKIAVLDTGVDTRHPDLPTGTKVVKAVNFSQSGDATDHFGHGTHVASIAVSTGAKSGGKYKGVAPGAQIISGKVLDDDGFGDDSRHHQGPGVGRRAGRQDRQPEPRRHRHPGHRPDRRDRQQAVHAARMPRCSSSRRATRATGPPPSARPAAPTPR